MIEFAAREVWTKDRGYSADIAPLLAAAMFLRPGYPELARDLRNRTTAFLFDEIERDALISSDLLTLWNVLVRHTLELDAALSAGLKPV